MATDILSTAVKSAIDAVANAAPSQAPTIAVEGVRANSRNIRGTVNAVLSSAGLSDPIGDSSIASDVKAVSLIFAASGDGGWFDATEPQPGDVLTFDDGRKFAVTSVALTRNLYYRIEARQC